MAEADEPEAGAPSRPPLKLLLEQADRLTALARTSWLTVIVGSLYVWLALAGLRDIQLFLPAEGLVLPFVNVEISTTGFFVFAPALLLSAFLYLHLTLSRLWECYGRILAHPKARDGRIEGLPVADRVAPWMLNALIENRERRFPLLSVIAAVAFAWVFPPLTVFAIGYRYLRAHEPPLTLYHSLLAAVAIVAAIEFWRHARRTLRASGSRRVSTAPVAVAGVLVGTPLLFVWAQVLIDAGPDFPGRFRVLTPNAQLLRAELSVRKSGWDEEKFAEEDKRRSFLRRCLSEPLQKDCRPFDPKSSQNMTELAALEASFKERSRHIEGVTLGRVVSSNSSIFPTLTDERCNSPQYLAPRDLNHADLRDSLLSFSNLSCTVFDKADLRGAQLEGADLIGTQLTDARLSGARMEGAVIKNAELKGSSLLMTRMEATDLSSSNLTGATIAQTNFSSAIFERSIMKSIDACFWWICGANFHNTMFDMVDMSDSNLIESKFDGASILFSWLNNARLQKSSLIGVDFSFSEMVGVNLEEARVDGALFSETDLSSANLMVALSFGMALKSLDLTETLKVDPNFAIGAFGDASVTLPYRDPVGARPKTFPRHWPRLMRPPHWADEVLDDDAFFGRWRHWREAQGMPWPPPGKALEWLARYEAVPPPGDP